MDRQELELRDALARREPSAGFASRVMAAVEREGDSRVVEMPVAPRHRQWRWAAVGALAASLTVGIVVEKRASERRAAEAAEEQIYEALLLAGSKIHHAREAVRGPLSGGTTTRPGGMEK